MINTNIYFNYENRPRPIYERKEIKNKLCETMCVLSHFMAFMNLHSINSLLLVFY